MIKSDTHYKKQVRRMLLFHSSKSEHFVLALKQSYVDLNSAFVKSADSSKHANDNDVR